MSSDTAGTRQTGNAGKAAAAVMAAAVLWFIMFSPWTAPYINFWTAMSCSAVILTALATCFRPDTWKSAAIKFADLPAGVAIAAALWCVFWIGDKTSSAIFGFARPQVELIYGIKGETSPWLLSALLLLLIGPAEELFWRGYIQRTLSEKWNADKGTAATLVLYSLVHVPSGNFMLVAAAFTAGLFWGLLYRFLPQRLWAIVISHAIWDAAVFVWFPI